tara:strand:- start:5083 stop:5748 length:666 start_codon:yes stop_codon:yes gene_type:complete
MYKTFFKRIFDIFIASIALFFLFPLFFIVIIILSITGEREVFYLQKRVGYKNKIFKIWKFATMVKNSSKMGTGSLTLRNDPRVLPFGKFLRKTKINELPQIINVLIGNMSIVGPRPQMEEDFNCYSEYVKKRIYDTKPGVTGVGSIIFRDEEFYISKSNDPRIYYKEKIAPVKGQAEMWYLENITFLNDFKIIALTAIAIVLPNKNYINKFLSFPFKKFTG